MTNKVIDESMDAGLDPDRPVTNVAKRLRLELLWLKAELERELGKLVLNCTVCDMEVHWYPVSAWLTAGIGGTPSKRRTANRSSSGGTVSGDPT